MSQPERIVTVPLVRLEGGRAGETSDIVVREIPVTLYLNDKEFVTMVCSPDHLAELAAGFLCSEGILEQPGDLKSITVNQTDGLVWVETARPIESDRLFLKRYITTCCGRGRASFYFINDARGAAPVESSLTATAEQIGRLANDLEERAQLFRATGGAHGAALCAPGEIVVFFEDIGRHNAVDKIFGHCYLKGIALADKLLVFSGRVSSEILVKVARMGIPLLVSRSAPTDLALEMASELGITVAGFARGDRMNIYTHPGRVITGG